MPPALADAQHYLLARIDCKIPIMALLFHDARFEKVSSVCPKKARALLSQVGISPVVLISPSKRAHIFESLEQAGEANPFAPQNGLMLSNGWEVGQIQGNDPTEVAMALHQETPRLMHSHLFLGEEAIDILSRADNSGCIVVSDWPEEIVVRF